MVEVVGRGLTCRRRLKIDDCTRYRNERATREVSPQRQMHYRGNSYLDAFCHKKRRGQDVLARPVEDAELLETSARNMSLKQIDQETAGAYGIYRGNTRT